MSETNNIRKDEVFNLAEGSINSEYEFFNKHIEARRQRSRVRAIALVPGFWAACCVGALFSARHKHLATQLKVSSGLFAAAAVSVETYAAVKHPQHKVDAYRELSEKFDTLANDATALGSRPEITDDDLKKINHRYSYLTYEGKSLDPVLKKWAFRDGKWGWK